MFYRSKATQGVTLHEPVLKEPGSVSVTPARSTRVVTTQRGGRTPKSTAKT